MANMQLVPAGKNVEAQYVEMMVPLYSYGCEKKINKALANLKGIYSVHVDFHQQKVTVWGICDKYHVLSILKNKRKKARFWNLEDTNSVRLQESHYSAPPSPQSRSISKNTTTRYLDVIKHQSLRLNLSIKRHMSLINWQVLKKPFARSNSF
ncbi:hypothetical protein OROHE_021796 [Orobanche hederae]